jgi:hypothetical protein
MIVIPSTVEGARRETLRVTQPAPRTSLGTTTDWDDK